MEKANKKILKILLELQPYTEKEPERLTDGDKFVIMENIQDLRPLILQKLTHKKNTLCDEEREHLMGLLGAAEEVFDRSNQRVDTTRIEIALNRIKKELGLIKRYQNEI